MLLCPLVVGGHGWGNYMCWSCNSQPVYWNVRIAIVLAHTQHKSWWGLPSHSLNLLYIDCRTSVSHMDFPGVVDRGLAQMLQNLSDHEAAFDVCLFILYWRQEQPSFSLSAILIWKGFLIDHYSLMQVHLVGAFDDSSTKVRLTTKWLN